MLKLRSNPLIFGGPVPPPYLARCAGLAIDVIDSPEYDGLRPRSTPTCGGCRRRRPAGPGGPGRSRADRLGAHRRGGGDAEAGQFLFDRGFYVQSVVFPAVPHGAGVLRMQVNANHTAEPIDGLLAALGELSRRSRSGPGAPAGPSLPRPDGRPGVRVRFQGPLSTRLLAPHGWNMHWLIPRRRRVVRVRVHHLPEALRRTVQTRLVGRVRRALDREFRAAHGRRAEDPARHGYAVWTGIGAFGTRSSASSGSRTRRPSGGCPSSSDSSSV